MERFSRSHHLSRVVAPEIRIKLSYIQTIGNKAVHSRSPIHQYDAVQVAKEVFHCCFWLATTYTRFSPKAFSGITYDETFLSEHVSRQRGVSPTKLRELEDQLRKKDEELEERLKAATDYEEQIKSLRRDIAEAKRRNAETHVDHDYSEAETRVRYIDLLLREAGWDPDFDDGHFKVREFPVKGMPNRFGEGFVDYVLWDNGQPLALIEAKRTTRDPRVGQHQAKLYADCLEAQFKQRPIIFYTNGYEHWLWDDKRYPPRRVQGFYKKDELQLLIQRRQTASSPSKATVNKTTCERYYQEQAIRHVTEAFDQGQRKALLVMATGSGKTRVVIALCDLLQRCNWVKRVLFLADRKALVKQATNAFKTFLPHGNAINLVLEKEKGDSRVLLSTYPTMMGLVDEMQEGKRRFGVGHFDLVVIDEAHRSVYQKYRALFDYFDSYLVGLTATPRDEVDRDTYSLFELAKGVPTYAYELEQAVEDGYLAPPKLVSVPIKFPREGIKYADLSEEEKEQWEMTEWNEDGTIPREVDPAALNEWLFNKNTVDKVLEHLMEAGLKVDGADKLGKTIIFAKKHDHAQFIQERFDANYPQLKGTFTRVIDNQETYAQDLIDQFADRKNPPGAPQIAISVDMLDTGIDVPEVVNLVFFKRVRSKTKFWQMIGRGTRLRPELFGPGKDKEFFFVFDYCGNFEFFNENPEGVDGSFQESIGTKVFRCRLDLLNGIMTAVDGDVDHGSSADLAKTKDGIIGQLNGEIASMNVDNFIVRPKRKVVEEFQNRERWKTLTAQDVATLHSEVATLPNGQQPEDPTAKFFDLLMLKLQLATLQSDPTAHSMIVRVREIATQLVELERIPMVRKEIELIQELQSDEFWQDVTLPMLERVRIRIRDLVKFIPKGDRKIVVTDFEDQLSTSVEVSLPNLSAAIDRSQYKRKFLQFLNDHQDHLALKKVKYNEPLTTTDLKELERVLFESGEIGDREVFMKCYGNQEDLGVFIRKLVGLDREAAKRAFDRYLDSTAFNSRQIQFINQIIDYLTQNGVMDPRMLFEHPFTNINSEGPSGLFTEEDATKIVKIIRSINVNAAVG